MNIVSISRWQWMLIGVLAGALFGYARESSANFYDELQSYGSRRLGQREFEEALDRKLHGKPCLTDVVVFPHRLGGMGARTLTLHVVSGLFFDGRTQVEDGKLTARWEPAYFVASAPYVPATPLPGAMVGGSQQAEFENVIAYLRSSQRSEAVSFRYLRWRWAVRPQFLWTCGGFVFIGLVWPTLVNLLVFGTLVRPRQAKGLSLWKVRTSQQRPATPAKAADIDTALPAELNRDLEASAAGTPPAAVAAAPPTPTVRTLGCTQVAPPATLVARQRRTSFGANEEDFYPTELRGKHEK